MKKVLMIITQRKEAKAQPRKRMKKKRRDLL
jgi:hypothetical protein